MNELNELLSAIELRYQRSLADPYDTEICENSIRDVPALIKALRDKIQHVETCVCIDSKATSNRVAALLKGKQS